MCLDSVAYRLRQVDLSFSIYRTGGDAYCPGECSSISTFDDGSWGTSVGLNTSAMFLSPCEGHQGPGHSQLLKIQ